MWNKDSITVYIHPTQAPPYITLAYRDDTGRRTAMKHAFDAPHACFLASVTWSYEAM